MNTILFPLFFHPVHFQNNGKYKIPCFYWSHFLKRFLSLKLCMRKQRYLHLRRRLITCWVGIKKLPTKSENIRFRQDFKDFPVQSPKGKKIGQKGLYWFSRGLRVAKINVIWLLILSKWAHISHDDFVG